MNDSTIVTVSEASRREKRKLFLEITSYLSPIIIIVVVFVFAPLTIILFYSFLK